MRGTHAFLIGLLAGACGGGDASAVDGAPPGPDADTTPPSEACAPPIQLFDTSAPTAVIGTGTAESCLETDLRAAAEQGGVITFNCGAAPATIQVTQQIVLPIDRDTVIDGGGLITLDGGGATRIFFFEHPDWMNNTFGVTLQRLTVRNGKAPAGDYFPQDPANPTCAYGYKEGSGGGLYVRNGVVHIIDCNFFDNEAALIGPDVGGGAVYVLGVPEVVITGSRFEGNRGANGGAVGMLFANPHIANSHFENNTAEGVGMNYVEPGCPFFNHDEQGGAGGNSGAVYFDGMNDDGVVYTICGAVFRNNRANELGGALFRTPNVTVRDMLIDRTLFDANTARMGGVSFIKQNVVAVRASTFMHNRAGLDIAGNPVGGPNGGLWINEGTIDAENSTFHDNLPDGISLQGDGMVRNVTFVASDVSGSFQTMNSLFVDSDCESELPGDHNLQWPAGGAPCAGGTTFGDPQLGAIGDNGGLTPTFLPAAGGPVEGVGASCPPTDQRGEPRAPATCAAGSVEP